MTTITAAKSLSLRCAERNGFSTVEAFTAARREVIRRLRDGRYKAVAKREVTTAPEVLT